MVGTPIGNVRLCRLSGNCWGGQVTAAAADASTVAKQVEYCRRTIMFGTSLWEAFA